MAGVTVTNGGFEQLQVIFDPYRAAELGIDIPTVAAVVGRANDASGGFVDVGRRQYTLRFEGRYDPMQFKDVILEWREGRPIRLGDIADVKVARGKKQRIAIARALLKNAPILGSIVGTDRTWGALEGRTPARPLTFGRLTTDDTAGVLRAYVGEGSLTDDPLKTFGNRAVAHIPRLQAQAGHCAAVE